MFYKIAKSGKDIDALNGLAYCKYEPKSKMVVACSESEKQGILSVRRDTYYHVDGWTEFGIPCQTVVLSEITESEYLELVKQLEQEDEVRKAISEISTEIQNQGNDISDLEDAVIELAEIIGG